MSDIERRRHALIEEMVRYYLLRAFSDAEMAEKVGTDRTNIYKIRTGVLEGQMGIPFVMEERGRYRIDRNHYVANIRLKPAEALALYLAGRRLQQQTKTAQQDVAVALEKLAEALHKPLAQKLVRAAQVIMQDQEQDERQAKIMRVLMDCWLNGRRVRIHHHTLHGTTRQYVVSPYQLEPAVWGDGVYLIGYSDYHQGLATFKLARIEYASQTTEPFTIPDDFDSHQLLQHAWGIWHADEKTEIVRLRFSPHVTPRIYETIWHPSQTIQKQNDGGCVWQAEIAEWREMEPWVRGWGSDVEVLEPAELREAIMADIQRSSRHYDIITTSQSLDDRLLRLWGKTGRQRESDYHPALYHMLDVAHVAQQLLHPQASPRWRRVLASALNANANTLYEWLPWLIALHDIGKLSVPFQAQNDFQRQRLKSEGFSFGDWQPADRGKLHHTIVGRIVLKQTIQHLPALLQTALLEMLGGHHGVYQVDSGTNRDDFTAIAEPAEWQTLRQRAMQLLASLLLLNEPKPWPEPTHLSAAIATLNGFTILCDWLGSDEAYFQPAAHLSLIDYLPRSRQQARERVASAGFFEPVRSDKPTRFEQLFTDIAKPRPLQQAIDWIPDDLLAEPTLTIIEASTGEGKTETALALAHRIAAATGSDELYVALPTMATSNAMFERIQEHLRDRLGLPPGLVQLVHGQNFLVQDDLRLEPLVNGDGESHPAITWLQPKRKALLAPFGVGTIDQAELSALNVRFNALRVIGLAGKVIVLDEVHAYDAYMLTIIERMVQWLAAVGSSVILLSATLPQATRRRLALAYNPALVLPLAAPNPATADYPSLLVAGRSQETPYLTFPAAFQPQRTIGLHRVNMAEKAWKEKAQWLVDIVNEGGCVCWIANTVERAQQIFKALQDNPAASGMDCILLHARFPLADRQKIEQAVLEKYGKDSTHRPQRGIVVGTQVLEQSLDLDFDVMMSDLAPIDLLLQRAGRLHRHQRNNRPPTHAQPRLYVNCELEGGLLKLGSDRFYAEYVLRQTWETIREREQLNLPADYRPLVEAVYHEEGPAVDSPLYPAWRKLQEERANLEVEAEQRLTQEPDPADIFTRGKIRFDDDEEGNDWIAAKTRWGEASITVIPLMLKGGVAHLIPTSRTMSIDQSPSRQEQLALLCRSIRLSQKSIVPTFIQQQAQRQSEFGHLFANSPLLRHCIPLRLEATAEEDVFTSPDLPLSLHKKLGIVVHRKEGK